MPRCHIRCNIITEPEKGGLKKLRPVDIKPYLPGAFHVPVKEIYEILGMSHHTLAPMRRELGLSRWPFADVCKGDFRMGGVRKSWDDVEDTRLSLMKGADERIVKILEVMGERALKHKHRINKKVHDKINKSKAAKASEKPRDEPLPVSGKDGNAAVLPLSVQELLLATPENESIANKAFAGEEYDWEGLSDLLLRHLEAPVGTLFPPPDELFQ
jgi:hypothetical protein